MKKTQLIFILALLGYCFTQTNSDICATSFKNKLEEKCKALDTSSCIFTDYKNLCIKKETTCSSLNAMQCISCHGVPLGISAIE